METFLIKWPLIFSFCITLLPFSSYAQNSELKKGELYNQLSTTSKFDYRDSGFLQANPFPIELEPNVAGQVLLYKRIEFPVINQRTLTGIQYLPLNSLRRINKAQVRLAYTSVVRSPDYFQSSIYGLNDLNSSRALKKRQSEISKRQQTINFLLNMATSLYINQTQQR